MSDLFHVHVPKEYVHKVFDVMVAAHWHQFQVLTKRSGRLAKLSRELPWPANVWMGVSVENADYVRRIDHLRGTGARVKFLSLEPLIGPLRINASRQTWRSFQAVGRCVQETRGKKARRAYLGPISSDGVGMLRL